MRERRFAVWPEYTAGRWYMVLLDRWTMSTYVMFEFSVGADEGWGGGWEPGWEGEDL